MKVRYNGASDLMEKNLMVQAYTDADLRRSDATFTVANGDNRAVNAVDIQNVKTGLLPVSGYLREGKNTFVVSVGGASNSTTSVSTIMGVARNVDVGWDKVEFEVELTDQSPICPRPSLAAATVGEAASAAGESVSTDAVSSHIYVYRYAVDEMIPPSSLNYGPILDKEIGNRSSLHEGDFLSDVDFDIDWSGFQSSLASTQPLSSAKSAWSAWYAPCSMRPMT